MNSSFDVLLESLNMKIAVLKEIEQYNDIQRKAFSDSSPDIDSFDEAIEKKTELIDKLEKLDDGFETLYERISEELRNNKSAYTEQIKEIQARISEITDLSMTIQASEARNKKLIEEYFAKERKTLRDGRIGSKVALDYYKNMSGMHVAEANFMDSRK